MVKSSAADAPPDFQLDPFLAIFGRWRQDKTHPAEWVDLADYAHMAEGPGILLAGHQGNFVVDRARPGLGLARLLDRSRFRSECHICGLCFLRVQLVVWIATVMLAWRSDSIRRKNRFKKK